MPSDAELRTLFQDAARPSPGPAADAAGIDTAAIIRRSKRRRLPRQLGAGSVLTLAVAGIGVASVTGLRPFAATTTADSAAESSSTPMTDSPMGVSGGQPFLGEDSGSRQAGAEAVNRCGAEIAEIAPSALGLELTARFPATAATGAKVAGVVTLTNTGIRAISGTIAAGSVVTVSRAGITLWHSTGTAAPPQNPVTLAPGESLDYESSFSPVRCNSEEELGRADLPALPPGEYQLTAALNFFPDAAGAGLVSGDLVSGPATSILLK